MANRMPPMVPWMALALVAEGQRADHPFDHACAVAHEKEEQVEH
jgi:hypothetical protein